MGHPDRRLVVTGGIGSGKSSVARLLEESGAVVVDADRIGHDVLEPDGPAYGRVAARWPSVVAEGRIDRRRLGGIVFADPHELAVLEAITHPEIRRILTRRVADADAPVVVIELSVPKVHPDPEEWTWVVVDAPDEVRIRRVVERGMDEADVRARMARQPGRDDWLALADVVIDNSGDLEDLRPQVEGILRDRKP